MILTKEAIEEMKKYYAINNGCTQAQEDIFNLCDTIESQSTQIEQLQEKVEKCRDMVEGICKGRRTPESVLVAIEKYIT